MLLGVGFEVSKDHTKPGVSTSAAATDEGVKFSATAPASCLPPASILPTVMITHQTSETVSQPPIKCFLVSIVCALVFYLHVCLCGSV